MNATSKIRNLTLAALLLFAACGPADYLNLTQTALDHADQLVDLLIQRGQLTPEQSARYKIGFDKAATAWRTFRTRLDESKNDKAKIAEAVNELRKAWVDLVPNFTGNETIQRAAQAISGLIDLIYRKFGPTSQGLTEMSDADFARMAKRQAEVVRELLRAK